MIAAGRRAERGTKQAHGTGDASKKEVVICWQRQQRFVILGSLVMHHGGPRHPAWSMNLSLSVPIKHQTECIQYHGRVTLTTLFSISPPLRKKSEHQKPRSIRNLPTKGKDRSVEIALWEWGLHVVLAPSCGHVPRWAGSVLTA